MGTITERLASWVSELDGGDTPERVRRLATSQLLAHLGALAAGATHPVGQRLITAFGRPFAGDPKQTAHVSAALTMLLDYDDTMYAGHVTHSTAGVALAYARELGLSGAELLTTTIAANEAAARITAAATLGHFRGQTASHTHLVGAIAARGRASHVSAEVIVDAWGLALSMPLWPLDRGFFGSDAKTFVAATPVRTALDAYDAAAAGLHGAPDILEHRDGVLQLLASRPLPEATGKLGDLWHTETLSIKVYPGCAYIDSAIDAAIALHPRVAGRIEDIEQVTVEAPLFTVGMEAKSAPYIDGPGSPLSAVSFSVPYNVAVALMRGQLTPEDLRPEAIADEQIWDLARRVKTAHASDLSRRALLATAPVGAALRSAGEGAADWVAAVLGGDREDYVAELARGAETSFAEAEKAIGARLTVTFRTGEQVAAAVDIPAGAAGPEMRRRHRQLAREKFLGAANSWMGEAAAEEVAGIVDGLDGATRDEVGRLVALLEAPFSG